MIKINWQLLDVGKKYVEPGTVMLPLPGGKGLKNFNLDKNFFDENGNQHEVDFPVNFDLKVIFDTNEEVDIQQRNLELVLEDAEVIHNFIKSRHSRKGNFVSLTVNITLNDMEQMKYMYKRLKLLPGIKFAI